MSGHRGFLKSGRFAAVVLVGALLPTTGLTCAGSLLNVTEPLTQTAADVQNQISQAVATAVCQSGPNAFLLRTFNAAAGRIVTVRVDGPTSSSRPQALVFSATTGSLVANTGQNPTSQSVSVTFTPSSSELFGILVNDCGTITAQTAMSTAYKITVNQ